MTVKVSLITVCYNSAATLRTALDSVACQQRGAGDLSIEYIVVDGGSSDGTVSLLRAFAAERASDGNFSFKWISEPDRGLYDAINKGLGLATGDVVGLLNADDWLEDDRVLKDVVAAFDGGIDGLYGDVRFVAHAVSGENRSAERTIRYYSSKPWRPWMHAWGYMPAHPTVYVRRTVFETFGGYRLGYEISADFEWMVRVLCRGGIRMKYLPRCMVTMRLGGKSTAGLKAMYRLNVENVRANRENGYFCCLPMMLPKYLFKVLGYFRRNRRF